MTLELIRSLWRDKPETCGRHYIFRDGKITGPFDVWCTDRERDVWVFIDSGTHKTDGCKVLLAEDVKQFIPLPIAPPRKEQA